MPPRRILTTCTAVAVGLLLVGGARLMVHAESSPTPAAGMAAGMAAPGEVAPRGGREGRGGTGGKRGGQGPEPASLTPEQVEGTIALMIELDPAMAPRIKQMRDERPDLLRHVASRRLPRLGYMLKLKESQPDFYALRVRDIRLKNLSHEQSRALAARPDGDPGTDAARAELRATLDDHFTVRQQIRRVEVDMCREQLAAMEAKLADDGGRREALVDERLAELEAHPPSPRGPHGAGDADRRRGRGGGDGRGRRPGESDAVHESDHAE